MSRISGSLFAQICDLKCLRGYVTHHAALMTVNALVGSQLDNYNSLFRSLTTIDHCKLQFVQNCLTRIITNTTKHSQITPVRKTLHWLPIEHSSIFKTASLVYKFLHSDYLKYTLYLSLNLDKVFITHIKAKRMVCSLRSHTLPLQFTKHFGLSFAYNAPKI